MRLDTWLDVACLFKTRSEATKACRLNKVIVNGAAAAHQEMLGEEFGRERFVEMVGQNAKMNSSALVNIIAGRIDRFRGEAAVTRDVTIITLKPTAA